MPLTQCGQGGYKWGESGTCFTGPDAKEKALAVGAAIKANDSGFIADAISQLTAKIDDNTGFLTTPVNLARVGVQHYYGFELGLADRALDKIGVFRSPEEVFSEESINSFVNLVVTDDHPNAPVNTDNVKALQKGTVSNVQQKDDALLNGVVTITDKDQIQKAIDGKIQVSVGYSQELIPQKGTFDGVDFEFAQTKIRANHLAIVNVGRAGPACKLTVDRKGGHSMFKITIDGIEFEVSEQVMQAYNKFATDVKTKVADAEAETEEEKKKRLAAEAEKDKAKATADALTADTLDEAAVEVLVRDRAALIAQAKGILKDKLTDDIASAIDIKTAVIDHLMEDIDLKDKSADYIDAMYDMAVKKSGDAKKSIDTLNSNLKDTNGDEITRDSIRTKYMKDHLGLQEVA